MANLIFVLSVNDRSPDGMDISPILEFEPEINNDPVASSSPRAPLDCAKLLFAPITLNPPAYFKFDEYRSGKPSRAVKSTAVGIGEVKVDADADAVESTIGDSVDDVAVDVLDVEVAVVGIGVAELTVVKVVLPDAVDPRKFIAVSISVRAPPSEPATAVSVSAVFAFASPPHPMFVNNSAIDVARILIRK